MRSHLDTQTHTGDELGAAYVRLALQIEQHLPGYIDAYFGPPEWKAQAMRGGKLPLDQLKAQARELMQAVESQPLEKGRRRFLARQVAAMQTTLRILAQEAVPFIEEVEGLYDVTPQRVDDAVFADVLREMDALLPGAGAINDRLRARRQRFEMPRAGALALFDRAKEEVRGRTRALFELPADEEVELRFVNDKPWGAYNWYLGRHRSLIEINTDSPLHANGLIGLMAHEGYPGHHTEHAIKEQHIYERRGWLEGCVLLINAPECVVSEGIATTAADVICEPSEAEQWARAEIYPRAGVEDDLSVEQAVHLQNIARALNGVAGNAALMLHVEQRPAEEVIEYMLRYGSRTRAEYERSIRFMTDPVFRSYTFTYFYGGELLRALFDKYGQIVVFKRVLSELLTPTDLREWLAA